MPYTNVNLKLKSILNQPLTLKQAKQIHATILINKFHHLIPLLIHQTLLSPQTYSKNTTQYVHSILTHMQNPDPFSWGCTIRFLSQQGRFKESCEFYSQMHRLGLNPTSFALSSVLRACGRNLDKISGFSIHGQVYRYGFSMCIYVQTGLVDFYSRVGDLVNARKAFDEMPERNSVSWNSILFGYLKSGDLQMACRVFDEIPEKDIVSWNSMVSGFARVGNMEKALDFFHQMPERNSASWNAVISGCVDCGDIGAARRIFDAMPKKSSVSWITMIAGYSKCGDTESARSLFDQLERKDLLVYNAMIACYTQNNLPREALRLFNDMTERDIQIHPDEMTFASVISACSQLGDLKYGYWIESCMNRLGILKDDHLTTAFIDLHAKCGNIDNAYELFNGLRKKDIVAYSAIISGCAVNGRALDAIKLFQEMLDAKIRPNSATFTGLLSAYNHAGLVEEGLHCFNSMGDHGLVASVDHYGIMVDLLGRAGRVEEAYDLIKTMPVEPHAGVWGALLLACRLHDNVEIGEIAARHCFELEPDRAGHGSLLSNIYSSSERWNDVKQVRNAMAESRIDKIPGYSWIG